MEHPIAQVRLLQQAKDAFAGGLPQVEDRSIDIALLKKRSGGGQDPRILGGLWNGGVGQIRPGSGTTENL